MGVGRGGKKYEWTAAQATKLEKQFRADAEKAEAAKAEEENEEEREEQAA
jgi:hypothetical protein